MTDNTKSEGMSDADIVNVINTDLKDGIEFTDSKLSTEREMALKYYYGEEPKRMHKGSSGYRSLDVYDQVEAARAILLETFTGSELPLELAPAKNKVALAVHTDMATWYVNHAIFETNDGEAIIDQAIFDGLTARIGVVRVSWVKEMKRETKVIPDVPIEQIEMLAAQPGVVEVEAEIDDTSPVADVTVTIETEEGHVGIDPIRPEDFLVNTNARDEKEQSIGHRITKRMSAWVQEGYDEDKLAQSMSETDRNSYDAEKFARNDAGDGGIDLANDRTLDPMITLVEAFTTLAVDKAAGPQLWRVLLSGDTILEKEVAQDLPFVLYRPLRVPHIFHGANFVKTIIPTANAKTVLTRGIIDHVVRTNNPRWQVVRGTFDSARELLDNKLGGLVNVSRPDGITPLPQAGLNPFAFQTIQLLDSDLSDTTGISRLTQGVDKEVISNQNSQGMMQDVAELSQQRLRMMARRFADSFLKVLAIKVYSCAQMNDKQPTEAMVGGQKQQVVPTEWPENTCVKVSLELSPAHKDKKAQQMVTDIAAISQDPQIAQGMAYGFKRSQAVKLLKMHGNADAEMAISPEPPKPDPMQIESAKLDLAARKSELQIRERQQVVAESKADTERLKVIQSLGQEERKIAIRQFEEEAKIMIQQRQQASKEANDIFEKEITLMQVESQPDSVKSVVAVNR